MSHTRRAQRVFWAYLIHLGYNMWSDREDPAWGVEHIVARPELRCETRLWREITERMADSGLNMLVIDLGEGVRYQSHPEIAAKGAWSPSRLRRELDRLRRMGIEPIPKLNFSACHDLWLGMYSRCLSTEIYYKVCRDLIREVCALFDRPRFFHLGMDEETAAHQRFMAYCVMRQHELWWHDLLFLVNEVHGCGARAWVWSDKMWHHPEEFFRLMPRSVLQSNWYYGDSFSSKINYVKAYRDLEAHRYDQAPTGSNWTSKVNFARTVAHARKVIAPRRLKGFLQTSWKPTLESCRNRHEEAIEQVRREIARW